MVWERLGAPTDNPGIDRTMCMGADEADIHSECRAYAVWIKQKVDFTGDKLYHRKVAASPVLVFSSMDRDFSKVATTQMGDHSAQEPKKVVPSRDITPGRRKEPLNRR